MSTPHVPTPVPAPGEPGEDPAAEAGRTFPRRAVLLGGLAALVTAGAAATYFLTRDDPTDGDAPGEQPGVFHPAFPHDGLVTNEYAFFNAKSATAHADSDWSMTSGSLFARAGCGWTGLPDGQSPGPESSTHTGSSVFRLVTKRRDFADCTVRTDVRLQAPGRTTRTPPQDWDGAHIWLRYHAPDKLYALSFRRRDGVVVVKRKTPNPNGIGAAGEQGDYVTLAEGKSSFGYGEWHTVTASAVNQAGGVRLQLAIDGKTVLDILDNAPERISTPGGVGLRGDNTELDFRDFTAGPAK